MIISTNSLRSIFFTLLMGILFFIPNSTASSIGAASIDTTVKAVSERPHIEVRGNWFIHSFYLNGKRVGARKIRRALQEYDHVAFDTWTNGTPAIIGEWTAFVAGFALIHISGRQSNLDNVDDTTILVAALLALVLLVVSIALGIFAYFQRSEAIDQYNGIELK